MNDEMNIDYLKYLCEKADYMKSFNNQFKGVTEKDFHVQSIIDVFWNMNRYEILMKCVFAINRERKFDIQIMQKCVYVWINETQRTFYDYDLHNNSELQAIEEALKFIKKETL